MKLVASIAASLLGTALAAPAFAQSPKPHRAPDSNGVDIVYGDHLMQVVEGSIGSGGAELALIRTGVWASEINGHQWDRIHFWRTVSSGSVSYAVIVGDRFETFTATGTLPSGSSLSGDGNAFVYRTADGMTIAFSGYGSVGTDSNLCTGATGQGSCILVPTAIAEPNGKSVSLGWEMWTHCWGVVTGEEVPCNFTPRLSSVSNSYGYSIEFAYGSGGSGGGSSGPSSGWFQRTGATFHNGAVSGNPSQASVSYAYPSSGVTEVTDMGGRVWRLTGSILGVTGIRRPGASSDTTTISYSSGNQVSSVVNEGVTTSYSRSVSGSTGTMTITAVDGDSGTTDPVTTVVSDLTLGRATSITDPLNRTTSYTYDSSGRLTRVTRPEGNYVQYTYDSRGNVTETRAVAKSGSGLPDMVTTASYDSTCTNPVTCNSPNNTTDARGNVTDYTYDADHGGVLTVTAPAPAGSGDRPQVRYVYALTNGEYQATTVSACASGVAPACADTAGESVTTTTYDANGNVTGVTRRDGTSSLVSTVSATYDPLGNLLTVDGPLSGAADTVRYRYNSARQLAGMTDPDPDDTGSLVHRAVRTTYANGLATTVEQGTVASQSDSAWAAFSPSQRVEQVYDANARPTVSRLIAGTTTYSLTQTSYDSFGRVQCVAQRMNTAEFGSSSLPSDACTLDTEGTHGPDRIARTYYNAAGQVEQVRTAYAVTGQEAVEAAMTYRSNGQVETLTDAEGNRSTYEYDGHDRPRNQRYPSPTTDGVSAPTSGTGADYEQISYATAAGGTLSTPLVASVRRRDGTSIAFTYDALGRMTLRDVPSGAYAEFDITYAYDLLGRLLSATSTHGHVASFTYDALGRTTGETGPMGAKSMQYDLAGRLTRLTWPDSFYVDYTYDDAGHMLQVRENGATSGAGLLAVYTYDSLGRRTVVSRGGGVSLTTWDYAANYPIGWLWQIGHNLAGGAANDLVLQFSHNPAGQISQATRDNNAYAWGGHYQVNRTYTANGLNQYTATGSISPTYDARGNLISAGSTGYAYTSENRLAASATVNLWHEPLGRMHQLYHYDGTTEHYTRFDNLGANIISETYANTGVLRRRHVYGPGLDEPLVTYEWNAGTSSYDRRYHHADERGSVIAASDSSGALVSINSYDEYGIPASGNSGRFQYTGLPRLPELGMQYSRNRIYSPTHGRFMQTDPIGVAGGINLYGYVTNDPVNLTDPSGLCQEIEIYTHGWYHPNGEKLGDDLSSRRVFRVNCGITGGGGGWGLTLASHDSGGEASQQCRSLANEPGAVHVQGYITHGTVAIGAANVSGTITNVNSGRWSYFTGSGFTAGAGVGALEFSGSFTNYASFAGGWDVSAAYIAQLGLSIESTPRNFSGNRVGEIDISPSIVAAPLGAFGMQVNRITLVGCSG